MKKSICLLALAILSITPLMSQKISGIWKGERLIVIADPSPAGDIIKEVRYAPLTKLENEVKNLKKRITELEKAPRTNNDKTNALTDSLKSVRLQLNKKSQELTAMQDSINSLTTEIANYLNKLKQAGAKTDQLNERISSLETQISNLNVELTNALSKKDENNNTLIVDMALGMSNFKGELTNHDYWSKGFVLSSQLHSYYTLYFKKMSPFALKFGIGFGSYGMNGSLTSLYDTIPSLSDADGDIYDARYNYNNIKEKVKLNYLEIPLLIHIGNSFNSYGVQAWIDGGLKIGINVGSTVEGSGLYSSEGYYPAWNVTIRDIDALGFVSNADVYANATQPNINKVVIWAVAAAGLRIPMGKVLALNMAVKCNYSLSPVATHEAVNNSFVNHSYNLLASEKTKVISLGGAVGLSINF